MLGRAEADAVGGLRLGEAVRETFIDSPQLADGRWLSLPICSDADLEDLLRLLSVRLPMRRRDRLDRLLEALPAS